jgi:hypothetical protein
MPPNNRMQPTRQKPHAADAPTVIRLSLKENGSFPFIRRGHLCLWPLVICLVAWAS